MGGVDADLQCLQPVARPQTFEREHVRRGRGEAVERGKRRRLARSKVSPDNAGALDTRIGGLAHLEVERAAGWFGGLLQTGAGGIVQPAMERAAQTAVLATGEGQIGAAMRAMAVQQAVASGGVAEQHEVLAQQANALHWARRVEFLGQRGRLPIAPHQRAAGGAGAGFGDQFVLLGGETSRPPGWRVGRPFLRAERGRAQKPVTPPSGLAATPPAPPARVRDGPGIPGSQPRTDPTMPPSRSSGIVMFTRTVRPGGSARTRIRAASTTSGSGTIPSSVDGSGIASPCSMLSSICACNASSAFNAAS